MKLLLAASAGLVVFATEAWAQSDQDCARYAREQALFGSPFDAQKRQRIFDSAFDNCIPVSLPDQERALVVIQREPEVILKDSPDDSWVRVSPYVWERKPE